VLITLKTPDTQFISAILNRAFIIPKHIWSKVGNPATFTNSNPVGSGPFNKLGRFTTQDYVLNKNPHYWKKGAPRIACVEYVQASSNDASLALIQSGQVDWTHNFVPERRVGVRVEGPEALPLLLREEGVPGVAPAGYDRVPVQHHRLPQGRQPGHRPQDRRETRRSTATPLRPTRSASAGSSRPG
jgi:ABC-type transport system substrate-binding protein